MQLVQPVASAPIPMSTMTVQTTHEKRLEGVRLTESLKQCLEGAQAEAREPQSSELSSASPSAVSASIVTQFSSITIPQAQKLLVEYKQEENENLPLEIIRAMSFVLGSDKVEKALSAGRHQLAFTSPPETAPESQQQLKWKQRMQRLALQQEERSYSKLTNNLGKVVQDDVSIRSMTYAASIGLNMIVAPISFGVFMYFFAGGIIDFIWRRPDTSLTASTVDNRKVICGVVSGVFMLIVEMLLFVIRTHEMDKAMRKKTKTRAVKPFGPYSSASLKTFKGE